MFTPDLHQPKTCFGWFWSVCWHSPVMLPPPPPPSHASNSQEILKLCVLSVSVGRPYCCWRPVSCCFLLELRCWPSVWSSPSSSYCFTLKRRYAGFTTHVYHGYKLNSHLTCFQRSFIAQLVEHRTGIHGFESRWSLRIFFFWAFFVSA